MEYAFVWDSVFDAISCSELAAEPQHDLSGHANGGADTIFRPQGEGSTDICLVRFSELVVYLSYTYDMLHGLRSSMHTARPIRGSEQHHVNVFVLLFFRVTQSIQKYVFT